MEAHGLSFSYSKTGSGGVLRTPHGSIDYLHEECFVYHALFDIIDYDEDGTISFPDSALLLERSSLAKDTIISLWKSVCGRSDYDSSGKIVVEQWLIVCKLIAQTQTFRRTDLAGLFEPVRLPLMNLHLNQIVSPKDSNDGVRSNPDDIQIDIITWSTVSDGLMNHVEYTLQFTITTPMEQEWQVNRRYSDFEFLSTKLRRYRGALIPPLPPKTVLQSFYQDVAVERSQELGLFLQNLRRHPVLHDAYEIQLFQRASPRGFRSFQNLVARLDAVSASAVTSSDAASQNIARSHEIGNLQSVADTATAYAAAASNVTSLAAGYAYRMWMSVSSSTAPLAPLAPPVDAELDATLDSLQHSLNCLGAVSAKLCNMLTVERSLLYESSRIAYYFEQCAALEGNPEFDKTLTTVCDSFNQIIDSGRERLEPQARDVLYNLQNVARFHDVLKDNRYRRQACVTRWNEAHTQVHLCRKQLDNARTSSGGEATLEAARAALANAETEEAKREEEVMEMISALKRDLRWVQSLKRFEMQGRLLGLATMRAALAQQNIETWSRIKSDLEGSVGAGDDDDSAQGSFL